MARAIPISDFRSSANMMKMLRIRTIPARIANELRMRKNWERDFAPSVALSADNFFSVNAHGIAGGVATVERSVLQPIDVEGVVDWVVGYGLARGCFGGRATVWLYWMAPLSPPLFVVWMVLAGLGCP